MTVSILKHFTFSKGIDDCFRVSFHLESWRTTSWTKIAAHLAASSSKHVTEGGCGIFSDSAAMISPAWSRITTPKPASPVSENKAPSKFVLKLCWSGGVHFTAFGRACCLVDLLPGCWWRDRNLLASKTIRFRGIASSFNLSLFRLVQRCHAMVVKSSICWGLSRISSTGFWKDPTAAFWRSTHLKSASQTCRTESHSQRAWRTVSAWFLQSGQELSAIIFLHSKLTFVGNAYEHAFHSKCLSFPGTPAFHNFFQNPCVLSRFEGEAESFCSSAHSRWYPVLTE